MRVELHVALLLASVLATGCAKDKAPAPPVAAETAETEDRALLARPRLQVEEDVPKARSAPTVAPPDSPRERAITPEGLKTFRGFSADEQRYAYSLYSEAAGFHLLEVVQGRGGESVQRFQLDGETEQTKALEYLRAGGFTSEEASNAGDVRRSLQARVEGERVRVSSGERVLYEGVPFEVVDGAGAPASVGVEHVSPSGRRVAVRIDQHAVTEFGGNVKYLLLDVEAR